MVWLRWSSLDRAQCHLNDGSVYDERGLMTLDW